MSRILITGAAGFIGSRLLAILLEQGYNCCGVDDLSMGCSPPGAHDNLEFHVQDVCQAAGVHSIFQNFRPTIVVHLAAIHHIPTCERNPSKALCVNVVGTQNVLEASDVVGGEKVVLASTGGVYDWVEGALTEETPVRPTDIYTLSKVTNEQQLALWVAKTGRAGIIARIFNTIGRHDRNGHLIPDILRQLGSNGHCAVVKLGNLDTRRDYIYVDDTAACLARIAQSEQCEGLERFNVGTGHQVDVRSIVECIARIRNRPVECQSDPGRMRRVDRSSQLADMTKTSSQLGWMPRYGLEEALRLTAGEEA